jgi:rhodanese-related sulfurtransferase
MAVAPLESIPTTNGLLRTHLLPRTERFHAYFWIVGVDEMLARARRSLDRVDPRAAADAMERGAVLVDIRSESQRQGDGDVPGAVVIARNVLEWRCDPASEFRDPRVSDPDGRVILMCDEGCQSSLAAVTLHELGLAKATDMDGGFQAWRAAGLPVRKT